MENKIRHEFKELIGKKVAIQGRVTKFGYINNEFDEPHNICVSDIYAYEVDNPSNVFKVDHLWIKFSKRLKALGPKQNQYISFTGIVDEYITSYGKNYNVVSCRNFKIHDINYRSDKKKKKQ